MKSALTLSTRYAGAIVILAMVLGGGAGSDIWTDHLIELLLIPAGFFGIAGLFSNRLEAATRVLAFLVAAVLAIQFAPVTRTVPFLRDTVAGFWSPAPHASLESALFAFAVLGFFLYTALMDERDRARLLPYFYIGMFVQAAVSIVQLSFSRTATLTGVLPFDVRTGLFANENHFSTLIFVLIPLVAYSLIVRRRNVVGYFGGVCLLVALLFAVGSRAGMGISSAIAIISLIWFLSMSGKRFLKIGALTIALLGLIATIVFLGTSSSLRSDYRWVLNANTLTAVRDHWLTGSGLGTFTLVYPSYESARQTLSSYANHAHNDFLEIFLELGVAGPLLLTGYFLLVLRNVFRSELSQAAFLAIMAISLQSIVDYPLRTMALAITFAYLSACLLGRRDSRSGERRVSHAEREPASGYRMVSHPAREETR